MKRGWKIFWIVCAVCAGIGLVCCSIAFIMGVTVEAIENRYPNGFGFVSRVDKSDSYDGYYDEDDDDEDEDDEDDEGAVGIQDNIGGHHIENSEGHHMEGSNMGTVTNTGSSTEVVYGTGSQSFTGVESIDAYMWGGSLEVDHASSSNEIRIETENISKRLGLKCYMDGNELKLVTKKKVIGLGPKKTAGRVIIHLPPDYQFQEASLELVAGYLHVDDICANELSIGVGAGQGVIENFTATEVDLDCGAGSLTAAGTAMAEASIDCGVGEIAYTASGKEKDYNYEIDCGVGEIVCGEASYAGLGAEKTISNNAAKHMDISCGIGSVAVNFSEM